MQSLRAISCSFGSLQTQSLFDFAMGGDTRRCIGQQSGARVRYVNGEDGTHFRGVDDWDIRLKRLLYSDRVDCVVCPGRLDHYMPRMIVPAHLMPHRYDADTHCTVFHVDEETH